MDDFTLKKAANYKPDLAARNAFLYSGYQPNYHPTFLEASHDLAIPRMLYFSGGFFRMLQEGQVFMLDLSACLAKVELNCQ